VKQMIRKSINILLKYNLLHNLKCTEHNKLANQKSASCWWQHKMNGVIGSTVWW